MTIPACRFTFSPKTPESAGGGTVNRPRKQVSHCLDDLGHITYNYHPSSPEYSPTKTVPARVTQSTPQCAAIPQKTLVLIKIWRFYPHRNASGRARTLTGWRRFQGRWDFPLYDVEYTYI